MPLKPYLCAITIATLGLAIISSSLAPSRAHETSFRRAHNEMPGIVFSHHDPYGAYYGKHKLGRDPDPNVQKTIKDAHRFEKGAY